MEESLNSLFNLVLNGIATPFFHNGTVFYDANQEALVSRLDSKLEKI